MSERKNSHVNHATYDGYHTVCPWALQKQDLLSFRNSGLDFQQALWKDLESAYDFHQIPGVFTCCYIKCFTTGLTFPVNGYSSCLQVGNNLSPARWKFLADCSTKLSFVCKKGEKKSFNNREVTANAVEWPATIDILNLLLTYRNMWQ